MALAFLHVEVVDEWLRGDLKQNVVGRLHLVSKLCVDESSRFYEILNSALCISIIT